MVPWRPNNRQCSTNSRKSNNYTYTFIMSLVVTSCCQHWCQIRERVMVKGLLNRRDYGLIDLQWVSSIGGYGSYGMRSGIGSQRNPVVMVKQVQRQALLNICGIFGYTDLRERSQIVQLTHPFRINPPRKSTSYAAVKQDPRTLIHTLQPAVYHSFSSRATAMSKFRRFRRHVKDKQYELQYWYST